MVKQAAAPPDRAALLAGVLEELTAHGPAARMRAMRHWHLGPLSLVHLHVLTILDTGGPLPMRGVAEALDVSQASATGIVDRMEQRGLVERVRDEADRRVVHVHLSPEGRAMTAGMATEHREHLARTLEELTDDELRGLLAGTRALRAARDRLMGAEDGGPAR